MGKNTKTVFDWILGSTKKLQSSKKGKRPLSSSYIPAPKYTRLLEDEGKVSFAHFRIEVSVSFYMYVYLCTTVLEGRLLFSQ